MQFTAIVMPLMMLVMNAGIAAAIWFGGRAVDGGTLHVGQVVAFSNYLRRTLMSLMMVGMVLVRISRAGASAGRIVEVLDSEPDVQDAPDARTGFRPQGRVAFEDVTFGYEGAHDPVLQDVSFVAEPGQTVAILGATGVRQVEPGPPDPALLRRGVAAASRSTGWTCASCRQTELRRSIGIALQESVLFCGTIRDNIRYGRPDASDEEVVAAAKHGPGARVHHGLPAGRLRHGGRASAA